LIATCLAQAKTAAYRICNNSLVAVAAHANDGVGIVHAMIKMPAQRENFRQTQMLRIAERAR
jgi:hypothetical protein